MTTLMLVLEVELLWLWALALMLIVGMVRVNDGVLKNSFLQNSQKKIVRMHYKRSSPIARTFCIPQIWPFSI